MPNPEIPNILVEDLNQSSQAANNVQQPPLPPQLLSIADGGRIHNERRSSTHVYAGAAYIHNGSPLPLHNHHHAPFLGLMYRPSAPLALLPHKSRNYYTLSSPQSPQSLHVYCGGTSYLYLLAYSTRTTSQAGIQKRFSGGRLVSGHADRVEVMDRPQ